MDTWIRRNLLKENLVKMFDRQLSYTEVIMKMETRRWNVAKETFNDYTVDKLVLMYRLDLPEKGER